MPAMDGLYWDDVQRRWVYPPEKCIDPGFLHAKIDDGIRKGPTITVTMPNGTSTPFDVKSVLPPGVVAGYKNDEEKLRYDLIPASTLEGLAQVLTFGAKKYADRNWEVGMRWGRLFAACMRHLWAWWRGEDNDAETGYSHLAHAMFCLAALHEYESTCTLNDDRPATLAARKALAEKSAAAVKDFYSPAPPVGYGAIRRVE